MDWNGATFLAGNNVTKDSISLYLWSDDGISESDDGRMKSLIAQTGVSLS
ncbi:MAG: hypothetical protein RR608_04270 [Bacteroidales bacterium]